MPHRRPRSQSTRATQITAVAPAGSAGTVSVTVTTVGGTSNGVSYAYVAVPTLTAIAPNAGPVTGGTTVVLTGTGLTGATAVNFGGTPATSFTVDSSTQITAVAPAGTGTVLVTVTTAGGTSNGVAYTYVAVPVLTSVVPNSGPVTGNTVVVLTGTGLTGATAVDFGASPSISVRRRLRYPDHRPRSHRVPQGRCRLPSPRRAA